MIITKDSRTGKTSKIVSEIFQDIDSILSLKFSKIETDDKVYEFNYPVLFQISQEADGTIIENELLDIYAAGRTIATAKTALSDQFDHTYKRLSQLNDSQLNHKLLLAKEYYHFIIKSVTDKK